MRAQLALLQGVEEVAVNCREAVETLVETAAVLCDGDGAVIGLSAYLAVSMLWGLARIIYFWWTGPEGGRFPPDVLLTEWVVADGGSIRKWLQKSTAAGELVCQPQSSGACQPPPQTEEG